MPFDVAHALTGRHLIVQPSDAALSPPESYLYVQDGLIISCGVFYALCYYFYMIATVRDRFIAGPVEFLCGTMAYELYYAFVMPSSALEFSCFIVWFLMDATFAGVAIAYAYPTGKRTIVTLRTILGVVVGVIFFHALCMQFPDEREQVTAYWTGWLLETPIGWGELYHLISREDTKGQSLEIWICRFLGCLTANGVFMWRYLNVPQNWEYVGSWWSIALVAVTIFPEIIYPYYYIKMHQKTITSSAKEDKKD
ncbi:uncharacterized protein PV09_04205 [Verruconis gallopava]|uniref:Uncharacterized protein n=1 Tax=Verruconis gallopava TaxID=253628 RepID=A0A0D2AF24_9PEZI|nr:uncharacterized protein PV09_04205 [Verruconis gallopava]KIW05050.1 hypothetical protein PV09_04205 [Verruconis gallopava]